MAYGLPFMPTRYLVSIGRDKSRVSYIRTLYKSNRILNRQMIYPSIPTLTYVRGRSLQSTSTRLPSSPRLPRENFELSPPEAVLARFQWFNYLHVYRLYLHLTSVSNLFLHFLYNRSAYWFYLTWFNLPSEAWPRIFQTSTLPYATTPAIHHPDKSNPNPNCSLPHTPN